MLLCLKDLETWEDYLSFIKFAYNISIHSSTSYSRFEIAYGFNPLTILDFSSLLLSEIISLDRKEKVELV